MRMKRKGRQLCRQMRRIRIPNLGCKARLLYSILSHTNDHVKFTLIWHLVLISYMFSAMKKLGIGIGIL